MSAAKFTQVKVSLFVLTIMLACSGFTTSLKAATLTIRVGYPQLNGGQTPLWNIPENKIDQKYGLDIKPVYIPGGVRLTQSVLSSSVDMAVTGARRSTRCPAVPI